MPDVIVVLWQFLFLALLAWALYEAWLLLTAALSGDPKAIDNLIRVNFKTHRDEHRDDDSDTTPPKGDAA